MKARHSYQDPCPQGNEYQNIVKNISLFFQSFIFIILTITEDILVTINLSNAIATDRDQRQQSFAMRSKSGPRYPAPIIVPAVRTDIPTLIDIFIDANSPNLMAFVSWPSREELIKRITKEFEDVFDSPEYWIMKALDANTKEITAMAAWQPIGYKEEREFGAEYQLGKVNSMSLSAGIILAPTQELPRSPLQKYLLDAMNAFHDEWIQGTKCIYLNLLMTDPRFQRRGIGTAMLNWGHERADRDGVPCFLIATPVGHPVYQHVGWKDISSPLVVDFKEFVPYAKNGDQGWGVYKYYYMLRLPKIG